MSTSTDIDLTALQDSAANVCRLMKAMANADRLLLLCQISQSEKSVGELEELTGIRQPTLSQQLTILRDAGLVDTRPASRSIVNCCESVGWRIPVNSSSSPTDFSLCEIWHRSNKRSAFAIAFIRRQTFAAESCNAVKSMSVEVLMFCDFLSFNLISFLYIILIYIFYQ